MKQADDLEHDPMARQDETNREGNKQINNKQVA